MTETETDKDDLVARLRLGGMVRTDGGYSIPREKETMREAADEIERLRLQLARAQANHKDAVEGKRRTDARLRVALKALQEIYDDIESDNRIIKIAGDAFNAATDDIAPADDIGKT